MPFSTINSISISINNSNITSVSFKAACHANPGAERNFAGSRRHISLKFSETSAKSSVSFLKYKSRYSPEFFTSKSLQTLFACALYL